MKDKKGKEIKGAWPATISLESKDGKVLYTHSLAMNHKNSNGVFHSAKFADANRELKVVVRDLATGKILNKRVKK